MRGVEFGDRKTDQLEWGEPSGDVTFRLPPIQSVPKRVGFREWLLYYFHSLTIGTTQTKPSEVNNPEKQS